MRFQSGDVLAHYRLAEKIGEGGMGVVWRATDTTLGRDVAIKVLPEEFATDPARLGRFEREAKLLASLNHPNIATLHGLHEFRGVRFLAMELVPGEDLALRLARGALPLDEAVDVARQTTQALEAAHEQGVVHRDLKPANLKRTPDGRVKVLDFGLAKVAEPTPATPGDAAISPTITSLGSVAGMILGTAAYMSPEQARGKPVDRRADVWAFGCVLFEMLSGTRPFGGETISDTLAAVLAKEPDWSALPAATPPRLRELIGRCLVKDPKRRMRDVGEARIVLESDLAPAATATATAPAARRSPSWLAISALAVAVAATALAAWGWKRPTRDPAPARLMRLRVERPPGETTTGPGSFAIAPDGSAVVFVARSGTEGPRLWLRELSATGGRDLPGTENADLPFWSADSRHIAFFAEGKLRRIPRAGGAVQSVCAAKDPRGGAWGPSGTIVFAPDPFSPLMKVAADGGVPEPATRLDPSRQQKCHRFPSFLPDGRRFVYVVTPGQQPNLLQVEVASLDDPVGRPLLLARNAPSFAPPDYLLFPRDQALVAQRIDLGDGTMTGDLIPLADNADVAGHLLGVPVASAAADGTLAYDEPDFRPTDALWFSRDGRPSGSAFRYPTRVEFAELSSRGEAIIEGFGPAGTTVALARLADGSQTRVIREERLPGYATWSPTDERIVVNVLDHGLGTIVSMDAAGGTERHILDQQEHWLLPISVGPDGTIVFDSQSEGQQTDIVHLPRGQGTSVQTYLATGANEGGGRISPDGRLLAYGSDASGRWEIYLDAFPGRRTATRVSASGAAGVYPRWRGDSRELFYLAADGTLMACDVTASPVPSVGKPHALFALPPDTAAFLPSPDGSKFLVFVSVGAQRTALTLVQSWSAQLEQGQER